MVTNIISFLLPNLIKSFRVFQLYQADTNGWQFMLNKCEEHVTTGRLEQVGLKTALLSKAGGDISSRT